MHINKHDHLTTALVVGARELVALVGSGGKSGALQLLVREACDESSRVMCVATTTTAMFLSQLQVVGPVFMGPKRSDLLAALSPAVAYRAPLAVARDLEESGKVRGLPPDWVDELWAARTVDLMVVEADGSRGMSLKAFGPHEPQMPARTSLVVQVAGLDALGGPLDADHVHRVGALVAALSGESGDGDDGLVTVPLFVAALRLQLRALRSRWPSARLATFLNKAEEPGSLAAGLNVARELLRPRPGDAPPEAVIVGSLREGRFFRCVSDAPRVSAVVLAAGRSTRMGAQKLLLPVDGRPIIEHVVSACAASRVAETVVVVGSEAARVRAAVGAHLVRIVDNPEFALGMSTSLRAGAGAVCPDRDAVVFVLGDQPFVDPALIDRLIGRFAEKGSGIFRPAVAGTPAHPVLMAAKYLAEIATLEGDVGAREIVERHPGEIELLSVTDTRSVLDVDTSSDYQAAREE